MLTFVEVLDILPVHMRNMFVDGHRNHLFSALIAKTKFFKLMRFPSTGSIESGLRLCLFRPAYSAHTDFKLKYQLCDNQALSIVIQVFAAVTHARFHRRAQSGTFLCGGQPCVFNNTTKSGGVGAPGSTTDVGSTFTLPLSFSRARITHTHATRCVHRRQVLLGTGC